MYDHHPQNWSIIQDNRGLIYVGNRGGLMEYDGVSWRLIEMLGNHLVRALAIDSSGNIYVGGKNELGILSRDKTGNCQYRSLIDKLKPEERNFDSTLQAFAASDGIYFCTRNNFLFRWDSRKFTTWKWENLKAAFICNGKIYIQRKKTGLEELYEGLISELPNGQFFDAAVTSRKINMLVPFDLSSGIILIGTQADGLYLYDGKGVVPFQTEADYVFKKRDLMHGIRLRSGEFAIATDGEGVIIIDDKGKIKHHFNSSSGLIDDNVKYIYQEEKGGNLWLALNNGISKIEYESPFSIYDKRSGLPGSIHCILKHPENDSYYIGTSEGLFTLSVSGAIEPVPGVSRTCYSLVAHNNSIIAGTKAGVFEIKKGNSAPVFLDSSNVLCMVHSKKYRNRIWAVPEPKGLISFVETNGKWEKKEIVKDVNANSIVEEKNGRLWLGVPGKGFYSVFFPASSMPVYLNYDHYYGIPREKDGSMGEMYVAGFAKEPVFATFHGLFRFDELRERFIRIPILGNDYLDKHSFSAGSQPIFRIAEDRDGNIWFHSNSINYHAIYQKDKSYLLDNKSIINKFLFRIPVMQTNSIYSDSKGVWFCIYDSLILFDSKYRSTEKEKFTAYIRRIERIDNKNLIQNDRNIVSIPTYSYDFRNIRFYYAAPFYKDESETQYQVFLKGYDRDWSDWTYETNKDYTNLPPKKYTFFVKARNVYGQFSSENDSYSFRILSPWYRTIFAFIGYILILSLGLMGIIRFRSSRLEKEKKQLELIVEQRTHEIKEKNLQLEEQTRLLTIQSEQLKEMDRVKSRFFANISHEFRTPLTLIMGPLEQMLGIYSEDMQAKNRIQLMLRNSQRLLCLINQLLDLSRLSSGKMRLEATRKNIIPFLQGIMASFKLLSEQRNVELFFITKVEDITLYFNPDHLEQIMFNLLSNAFKNTPQGGAVTVLVQSVLLPERGEIFSEGFLEITVADTGVGISDEQLSHMFELFYQPESFYENKSKGTGIGLALTRELVELHHGDIGVRSTVGKGAEFVFHIPLGKNHLKPEEFLDITQQQEVRQEEKPCHAKNLEKKMMPVIPDDVNPESLIQITETSVECEQALILVVEDNNELRGYLSSSFGQAYRVMEAVNGKDGWEKAVQTIPDIIISDVAMPEMDGFELCKSIKKDPRTSHIPMILLTVHAAHEQVLEGLRIGADDYIQKPFSMEILWARVKNLIELRRQFQERIKNRMSLQPEQILVSTLDEDFYEELKSVIEKHISDVDFNVEYMADMLKMGRTTLYRKILALTGETPNQFIRSYRLHRGAKLLEARVGNVSEVANMVGFSNPGYFAHCFKEKYSISPSVKNMSQVETDHNVIQMDELLKLDDKSSSTTETGKNGSKPDSSEHMVYREQELILIVEDSADVCDFIREPIEKCYNVEIAHDGLKGFDCAQSLIPDLIISDVMMPGMDGFELSRRLKINVATSHIPIILLTARASEKDILKGFETGVDDYITKPFNTDILMARIGNILRLRSYLQDSRKRELLLEPVNVAVSSMDETFMEEVNQCIEENLSDFDFNVEVLADKLLVGRSTLYRKVLALTGENPTHYIRSYRLNKAAKMLMEKECSITDVAFDVGFSSTSYFTKCFKEMFHRLPSGFVDSEADRFKF